MGGCNVSPSSKLMPRRQKRDFRGETLERRLLLDSDPFITEFMASNDSGLSDGFDDSSDWIEI